MKKFIVFLVLIMTSCTATMPLVDANLPLKVFAEEDSRPNTFIEVSEMEIGYLYTPYYEGVPTCSIYQRDLADEDTLIYFTPEVQQGNCRNLPEDIGFVYEYNQGFIVTEISDGIIDWTEVPVVERIAHD